MSLPEKSIIMDPAMQDFLGTTDPQEYELLLAEFCRNLITKVRKSSQTPQGRKRLQKAGLPVLTAEKAQEMLANLTQ